MKVEQLQTENNAAGGLSDLTDVLGVAVSPAPTFPILTGRVGTNADQFPDVLEMYVPEGATVADVTYGKGVFWRNIPDGKYNLLATDLQTGTDFSRLPYENQSIDALVLDPPYMHGGVTVKASINECYKNQNTSHASVVRLYAAGILEAARVLRKKGRIIVKTQDEIESGKQRLTHVELINILESFGFCILDIFVLLQPSIPAMREQYQKSARKNHSFAIVGEFRS
mgnify:FL=1|jgi:hypothetical protein